METFISSLQIELLVELLNEDSLFFTLFLTHSLTLFMVEVNSYLFLSLSFFLVHYLSHYGTQSISMKMSIKYPRVYGILKCNICQIKLN